MKNTSRRNVSKKGAGNHSLFQFFMFKFSIFLGQATIVLILILFKQTIVPRSVHLALYVTIIIHVVEAKQLLYRLLLEAGAQCKMVDR